MNAKKHLILICKFFIIAMPNIIVIYYHLSKNKLRFKMPIQFLYSILYLEINL